MNITKDEAIASLVSFIKLNNRYPTKKEMRENENLFSQTTYLRLLGPLRGLTLLSEFGTPIIPPERFCLFCQKSIVGKWQKLFCGASCSAKHSNPLKPSRSKKTKSVIVAYDTKITYKLKDVANCVWCNGVLSRRSQKLYCKPQCKTEHAFRLRLDHWLETGESTENRNLRKFITYIDGYTCSCCGLSDWNNKPITLEVEHINGNSEDDSRENVCLICPNCHSQTDTYKGKNRGNGRHARAQRYRDGKSY